MIKKLKNRPRSEKGSRVIEREREIRGPHSNGYEEFHLWGYNCFMLDSCLALLFDAEDGGNMFLRNVC
jgi:hypothetical protein